MSKEEFNEVVEHVRIGVKHKIPVNISLELILVLIELLAEEMYKNE